MSLDDDVRSTLETASQAVPPPDLDQALDVVVRRADRRRSRRRAAGALVALGCVGAVAYVALRPSPTRETHVATQPAPPTSATPTTLAPDCPIRYRFAYVPDGWSLDEGQSTLRAPTGTVAFGVDSVAKTELTHVSVVGYPATIRTNGAAAYQLTVDRDTAPVCESQIAVVGSGISQTEFELVATSVQPVYSLADRQQFRAVWPSSDLIDVLSTAGSDGLTDPDHAAISFAVDQLGWHGGEVVDKQPSEDGTFGADLTIRETPQGPPLYVTAIPLPGTGYWAVSYASTFTTTDEVSLSVEIHEDPTVPDGVTSSFQGAASADLRIYYGPDGIELTASQLPATWTFEVPAHQDIPGALTIRWRDAQGVVVAVHATSLPPGDFAAG